nr:Retrovirus-related Pol polyprotein from transposon RE1 [Ipomoea batatas]
MPRAGPKIGNSQAGRSSTTFQLDQTPSFGTRRFHGGFNGNSNWSNNGNNRNEKCLDPSTNRLYLSRHVKFVDHCFPYEEISASVRKPNEQSLNPYFVPCLVVRIPIPASASDQSHTQSDIPVAGQSDSHVADTPGSSQTPSNSASPQELPAVASPQDSVHPQSVISTESSSQSVAPQEPHTVASPQDSVHPQPVISTESSS